MTSLWQIGRADPEPAIDDLVLTSRQVRQVQLTIAAVEPCQLLEPVLFARNGDRAERAAESPILSSFHEAEEAVLAWQEELSPGTLRRDRMQAGSLGLELQLDGVRLELAVRLRQSLHPNRMRDELGGMYGVGLRAADRGYLLVAQVTESTRVVYGTAGALLGAAYVVRAIGDIGDGTISWLSPIGVAQKARPYADERWWPLLLLVVATVVLVAVASALAERRDLGAGLLAARPGPPAAAPSLGSPLGLAFRLQRGSLLGWAAGILVIGIAYGWIGPTIDDFVGQNKALAELLAGTGAGSLTDLYFATALRIMALIATGFAVQAALRVRGEETSMRAELVLATPVSRWRFAGSHLALAAAGSVILLAVAGLATGVSYGLAGGGMESVPRLLVAALVYAPAMWLMAGLAIALDGLAPRLTGLSWAILGACLVVGFLGPVLGLPGWVEDLSPFQQVPQLPAASPTLPPLLAISAVAAGLMALGLIGLRRRDIGRT